MIAACVLSACAALLFLGVAAHEWMYRADHPGAYGPAAVIAVACVAGALLAGVVAAMAYSIDYHRARRWADDVRERQVAPRA